MSEQLVIVGAGEFAEIAYEYFTHDSPYTVKAFAVEEQFLKRTELFGLPVVPLETIESSHPAADHDCFVAVTYTRLNRVRARLFRMVREKGYRCATYVSSRAFVWHNVTLGANCFIFENNVIQYSAEIGDNVVLWSGNHIGHRSKIGDDCFISSQVVVSGYAEIGSRCFVGVNASVGDFVKVAADNVIGAGAVILKNTEPEKVYRGNPAVPAAVSSLRAFNVGQESK
jgi:sugar O-acyltransferase (sialic acid O-acetyltransferase NeuD family)